MMMPYKRMKAFISNLSGIIFCQTTRDRIPLCSIEEIDISQKTVSIHCKGVRTPIKLTFYEIINDDMILSNLSPKHASWVGYYYGKYYTDLISQNTGHHDSLNFDFSTNASSGKLNILMLARNSDLIYLDKNDKSHIISPIKVVTQENLIAGFDPIQACYIGILAGTSRSKKRKNESHTSLHNVQLTLVK